MCYVDFSTVFSCCHFFVTAAEICPSCRHTQISTYFYSVLEILKYIYSLDILVFIGDVIVHTYTAALTFCIFEVESG